MLAHMHSQLPQNSHRASNSLRRARRIISLALSQEALGRATPHRSSSESAAAPLSRPSSECMAGVSGGEAIARIKPRGDDS
eukprot:2946881-Pleurochrysis_carterae.AAC.1